MLDKAHIHAQYAELTLFEPQLYRSFASRIL
jgi:hypothetical protein